MAGEVSDLVESEAAHQNAAIGDLTSVAHATDQVIAQHMRKEKNEIAMVVINVVENEKAAADESAIASVQAVERHARAVAGLIALPEKTVAHLAVMSEIAEAEGALAAAMQQFQTMGAREDAMFKIRFKDTMTQSGDDESSLTKSARRRNMGKSPQDERQTCWLEHARKRI